MPSFKMDEVAQRLGVRKYWLQARLSADRRSPAPRLQFHHYLGTTSLWTHDAFESLERAIAGDLPRRRWRARKAAPAELRRREGNPA